MSAPFRRMEQTARSVECAGQSATENLCELCQRQRPPFVHAAAHGVYEGTLRALIHLLKYEKVTTVAQPLGKMLAQVICSIPNLPQVVTVVVVPLHPAKERQRGFNQTALLAGHVAQSLRRKEQPRHEQGSRRFELALRALGRQRATESQAGLTARGRRRNLRGAFFVAEPERIAGRAVLLLDDIYTTGATARECTRTLLAAGAASVFVATLARSQREGVAFWDAPVMQGAHVQ